MGLFDFLNRRQRQIEAMVYEYLDAWEYCLRGFEKAMGVYLEIGPGDELSFLVEDVHKRESRADDLRRKVERKMYEKALLPESRGDILGFLEAMDSIPNRLETILFIISEENVSRPEAYSQTFERLLEVSYDTARKLLVLARGVFAKDQRIDELVEEIDKKESECDHLERELIRRIFRSDELDGFERIALRDLILKIGDITDMAESIADRLMIMSYKRKV